MWAYSFIGQKQLVLLNVLRSFIQIYLKVRVLFSVKLENRLESIVWSEMMFVCWMWTQQTIDFGEIFFHNKQWTLSPKLAEEKNTIMGGNSISILHSLVDCCQMFDVRSAQNVFICCLDLRYESNVPKMTASFQDIKMMMTAREHEISFFIISEASSSSRWETRSRKVSIFMRADKVSGGTDWNFTDAIPVRSLICFIFIWVATRCQLNRWSQIETSEMSKKNSWIFICLLPVFAFFKIHDVFVMSKKSRREKYHFQSE